MTLLELIERFGRWSHDHTDINRTYWPDAVIAKYLWQYFDQTIVRGTPGNMLVIRLLFPAAVRS